MLDALRLSLPSLAVVFVTQMVAAMILRRMLARHEAALTLMREQLKLYDLISQRQGDAEHLLVRHQVGTNSTWVDIVLTAPGISLRMPIRPDQMKGVIANLRGEGYPGGPTLTSEI